MSEQTTIFDAARYGDIEAVKSYVQAGKDLNVTGEAGFSLLHFSTSYEWKTITAELIKANANVNLKSNNGNTPLRFAAQSGCVDSVMLLINAGAVAHAPNKFGETPLHHAADHGNTEIVKLLIEHGAEVNYMDGEGKMPIDVNLEGHPDTIEVLLKLGAKFDHIDVNHIPNDQIKKIIIEAKSWVEFIRSMNEFDEIYYCENKKVDS